MFIRDHTCQGGRIRNVDGYGPVRRGRLCRCGRSLQTAEPKRKAASTVIEWSLNELGSLNNLAVGPHNLHILPGYLDGQMPYVPGAFHR